jgi:hypothetical protein
MCSTSASYEYNLPETESEEESVVIAVEMPFENMVTISPNPTRDETTLEIPGFLEVKGVRIVNATGQIIGTLVLQQAGDKKIGKIELSPYPSGTYIICITTSKSVIRRKLIKL